MDDLQLIPSHSIYPLFFYGFLLMPCLYFFVIHYRSIYLFLLLSTLVVVLCLNGLSKNASVRGLKYYDENWWMLLQGDSTDGSQWQAVSIKHFCWLPFVCVVWANCSEQNQLRCVIWKDSVVPLQFQMLRSYLML